MLTSAELLRAYDEADGPSPICPSGFSDLDVLTGGFVRGRIWVLVGAPGEGRSTLAVQWAAVLGALAEEVVHLVTPRDEPRVTGARLLSQMGLLPLRRVASHDVDQTAQPRLAQARRAVSSLSLSVYAKSEDTYIPEVHPLRAVPEPTAIVIDDAELVAGLTCRALRTHADAGRFVLVTVPRHRVMRDKQSKGSLDPDWAQAADVILEVRHRELADCEVSLRPGEAEILIRYNRWGPMSTIRVLHQPHFARFVEASS